MEVVEAYAAGLFEGEGSVFVPGGRGAIRMTMSMADHEPLDRLVEVWGGVVFGPYERGSGKPMFNWQLSGWDRVEQIFAVIGPLLSPRRRSQFERALALGTARRRAGMSHNALKTHCKRGHPFDDANTYRSPRGERTCKRCRRERKQGLYA